MISPVTGEVVFDDGLHFGPHEELNERHVRDARSHRLLPTPGWTHHVLGTHSSSLGPFEVEAVSDRDSRIQMVFLWWAAAHISPSRPGASDPSERRTYHEAVIAADLLGQREFSWGEVFCNDDIALPKDWIVVTYALGPHVSQSRPRGLLRLYEHEPEPDDAPPHPRASALGEVRDDAGYSSL